MTDMEVKLMKDLKEKRDLSDTSIATYIRNLKKLNDDKPITNFKFLNDPKKILEKLKDKKDNTKRNYLISVVGVLSLGTKPTEKKLYKQYHDLMINKADEIKKNVDPHELTEQQEKNWMTKESIDKVYEGLKKQVDTFKSKDLTDAQYNTLLHYVILSLYLKHVAKRNKDYQYMYVVPEWKDTMSEDYNYYDLKNKLFIFNNYKTSKKHGQMKEKVSEELQGILNHYLKYHPAKKDNEPYPLLVHKDGSPLDKVNSMTRILNKVFGKQVGSSMLRHIVLSDKYGDIVMEQEKTAKGMGHSVATQKDYVKIKKPIIVEFD